MKRHGAKRIRLTDAVRRSAAQVLSTFPVQFAYMFGSALRGRVHSESDVDIAAYLDPSLPASEQLQQLLALHAPLARALDVPDEAIDLTLLNRAPLLLQHVVRTEGEVLYEHDHDARVEFELSVMRRRDDENRYRQAYNAAFLARRSAGAV